MDDLGHCNHRRGDRAIWSGVGIVLITLVAWLLYGQALGVAAITGLGLIVAGVVVLNVFSKSISH